MSTRLILRRVVFSNWYRDVSVRSVLRFEGAEHSRIVFWGTSEGGGGCRCQCRGEGSRRLVVGVHCERKC